jgi:transcriptional regulator with PAS, ATPase and Fis domain
LALPYKADEAEKTKLTNQINNAQGSENAGSVIVIDGFNKETMPEMLKTDNTDHDKMYDLIDNATKNSIRRVVNVPPVLVGDLVAGKLGTSQEVTESEQMFEKNTNMFRIDIEEALYDVLSKFYIPYTNIKIQTQYGAS